MAFQERGELYLKQYRCPYCGNECISAYKKLMTKGNPFDCSVCGKEIWQKPKYENSLHSVYDIVIPIIIAVIFVLMLFKKQYILLVLIAILSIVNYSVLYLHPHLFFALVNQRDERRGVEAISCMVVSA